MTNILTVLRCFDRPDVQELRLQSDSVITVLLPQGPTPLTKSPLNNNQLMTLFVGTPVEPLVQNLKSTDESMHNVELNSITFQVAILKRQDRLQIKFVRSTLNQTKSQDVSIHSTQQSIIHSLSKPSNLGSSRQGSQSEGPKPSVEHIDPIGQEKKELKPNSSEPPKPAIPQPKWQQASLSQMLNYAKSIQASDLHLMANGPVRIRVAGKLSSYSDPLSSDKVQQLLLELLQDKQKETLKKSGYVDLAVNMPDGDRVRINIGQQATGIKGCFRLIPSNIPTLEQLGLPTELAKVTTYHQGLAIIAGPNGQGKTTTLAALVDLINAHASHHIITVEDPIEFLHPIKKAVISQRQVGEHTASFARALKAALREDPDVIVIGELRDKETVEIALSAAETGHLVIATMSTRSAAKTIDRLIDMFPPADQAQVRATLAGALKIIVAQRLLPRSDDQGVIAASELITGSVPLWNLIRDNKLFQLPSLQARGRGLGMIRFDTSLLELHMAGKITEEVAKASAEVPTEFDRMLQEAKKPPVVEDASKSKNGGMTGLFSRKGTP